jgi:glycerophosphoryl diester phosphodiesterase
MTIVVAHAGASGHAPANTLGAYRRAHNPVVWMEFDTQFAKDDLVVIHDETLQDGRFVADHTAEELKPLDIATTRELLAEGARDGWRLVAELKNIPGQRSFDPSGERYADAFNGLLEETGFPIDRLNVICFWAPTLVALRERNPDITLGFLTTAATLDLCLEHRFDFVSVNHKADGLDKAFVDRAHDAGIGVHVWTADEPDDIAAAKAKGVDAITSNYPERVSPEAAP